MVKAHQSDWSLPFSLDAISSMSLIACKDLERKRKYRILAEIATSNLSPQFTKIVTFLPYFYIKNETKRTLRFMEENEDADLWNDLLPGQGVAFWPYTESMKMRLKWKSSQLVSQHFDVTKVGRIVLRMENGVCENSKKNINQRNEIFDIYYKLFFICSRHCASMWQEETIRRSS